MEVTAQQKPLNQDVVVYVVILILHPFCRRQGGESAPAAFWGFRLGREHPVPL